MTKFHFLTLFISCLAFLLLSYRAVFLHNRIVKIKMWISQEQEELLTWNKCYFSATFNEVNKNKFFGRWESNFKILNNYLDHGENCKNVKYHQPAKNKEEDRSDILSSQSFL